MKRRESRKNDIYNCESMKLYSDFTSKGIGKTLNGTLKQYVREKKNLNKVLNVKKMMKQILAGLDFIHSHGIIHRDIKMDNIMVQCEGEDEIIKIIDFGFSVQANSADGLNERCGTIGYLAPEIVNSEKYDKRCDIYSLGQVFHILLTNYPMYGKEQETLKIINLTKSFNMKIDTGKIVCPLARDLLNSMIKREAQRFSASQCLNHRYFGKKLFSEIVDKLKSLVFKSK